jgi:hypothetical protein
MIAHCHIQIREVAKAAAGQLYQRLVDDNQYYEAWRQESPDAGPQELEAGLLRRTGRSAPPSRAPASR